MQIFLYYQYFIIFILFIILINFAVNNLLFKKISSYSLPSGIKGGLPLVSILVPARNEEDNIEKCLNSLLAQDYPLFEIILLDDNSGDSTYDIARKLSEKENRLKAIRGKKLKPGWQGKNYACWQLASTAKGDMLLFTDADTFHAREMVSCSVSAMLSEECGGLSIFSRQTMVTFHERMMVPFGNLVTLCFMPLDLLYGHKNPLFSVAMGQFIMFRREVYDKIGGHKTIKKEILEDVYIARMAKKRGFKFMIFNGENKLSCRMYKNLKEVIRGYSRILFPAFNYNLYFFFLAVLLTASIFLLPFILLPVAIILSWPLVFLGIIMLQVFFILLIRITYSLKFKTKIIDVLLHPISIIYLLIIAINSFYKYRFGSGIKWKDRGL